MREDPITVPRAVSLRQFVEEYVYKHHFKMFPVVEQGRLLGCVTTRDVKQIPGEEWDRETVGTVTGECTVANSIHPDEDAMKALTVMNRSGNSRLLVVEHGRLVGVIALKDLLRFLSLKLDLEGKSLS